MLKSAQGSRVEPMLMAPTTAGYSLTSVGYALRATAMKVLDGVIEADHLFCVLYELDEGDDWQGRSTSGSKAAPMIGITPTLDYVRQLSRRCASRRRACRASSKSRSATAGCMRRIDLAVDAGVARAAPMRR